MNSMYVRHVCVPAHACGYVCSRGHFVCPTEVCRPPESTVPNNETTSCLIHVRGEEQHCILGVAHQHPARGDASAEFPCGRRGRGTGVCVCWVYQQPCGPPAETVSRSWRQSVSFSKSRCSNSKRMLKPGWRSKHTTWRSSHLLLGRYNINKFCVMLICRIQRIHLICHQNKRLLIVIVEKTRVGRVPNHSQLTDHLSRYKDLTNPPITHTHTHTHTQSTVYIGYIMKKRWIMLTSG